ncbi:MAG: pyruvate formate lyase-activating protein [Erysipelotrichaceae bacterium]|nr:pyruvate formate lyase-activating protein [Erysipelotrichaceae bacterium]
MTLGRIHSLESMGTVDGPGIRLVVFVQGCPMRCLYCHNPDTWRFEGGTMMEVDEILESYDHNAPFYKQGGITVTGGEPMMQKDFVAELFTAAKKKGIHTCLDTSGIAYDPKHPENFDALLNATDLVLLDIKNIDPQKHLKVTSQRIDNIIAFAQELDRRNIPVWIRHVYVNEELNTDDELYRLGEFIGGLKNIKAVDVLPYHTMGKVKYDNLGIPYPLEGIKDASKDQAQEARRKILQGMKAQRVREKGSQN